MYKIVYYYRETVDNRRNEYNRNETEGKFRLRRNAMHYIREILKQDYIEQGFAIEQIVGGIYCYNSEKIENGGRKIIEIAIKAEKA